MPPRHLLTIALLACALFLRVVVPAGWMPAEGAGLFAVEPCPAAGPAPMMHISGGHHDDGDHKSSTAPHTGDCAFQPISLSFAEAQAATIVPPIATEQSDILEAAVAVRFARGPPAPPPPATGPPALA